MTNSELLAAALADSEQYAVRADVNDEPIAAQLSIAAAIRAVAYSLQLAAEVG